MSRAAMLLSLVTCYLAGLSYSTHHVGLVLFVALIATAVWGAL